MRSRQTRHLQSILRADMTPPTAKLSAKARTLPVGDPRKGEVVLGALIDVASADHVQALIQDAKHKGAHVVAGGERNGVFVKATVIDNVTRDMDVYREEIFGPVLSVVRADSVDEAIALINANPYGNGTAIFTSSGEAARRFQRGVNVGMIGINVPIPVPMAYYSFGGWKNSLFGDSHAHGAEGVHFFTRGKVITSRWLDPSHGGLNLGFPQNA